MAVINSYDDELDKITITWSVDDVLAMRPGLTVEQARDVLQYIEHNHDASIGVTWDVITYAADYLFEDETIPVHEFRLADVEDPHLYAQMIIQEWVKSQGENAIDDVTYSLLIDETTGGWKVKVYDAKSED